MNAWIELFIILGKIFFAILVTVLVVILMYPVSKWIDKGEADKPVKPKIRSLTIVSYDRKGRKIERRLR